MPEYPVTAAKACVVDAIRRVLYNHPRNMGFGRLCERIHFLPADVWSALQYLQRTGEAVHDKGRGWRYVPQWESKLLERVMQ